MFEFLFTKNNISAKVLPAEMSISHIEGAFKYEHDPFQFTWTDENIENEELLSFSDDTFDFEYAGDTIVSVIKEAPNCFFQRQLTLF